MKRNLLGIAAGALLSLSVLTAPAAAAARAVPVTVDGVSLPRSGYLYNGVTTVPLRMLLETAGGWVVDWDAKYSQAVAVSGSVVLTAKPDERTITFNGGKHTVPVPVYIHRGSTYVPIRAVGEVLGWDVEWDASLGGASVVTGNGYDGGPGDWDGGTVEDAFTGVDSDASNDRYDTEGSGWTEEDLYWLSRVISAESQGEPMRGQMAVGNVVLNRVASDEFPDTIKGVVFDARDAVQFEPVSNGTIYNTPTGQSVEAAKAVLSGAGSVVGDCLYFYAPALSQGLWINQNRTYYTTIGCHRFYL